jgi:hypothetical protein
MMPKKRPIAGITNEKYSAGATTSFCGITPNRGIAKIQMILNTPMMPPDNTAFFIIIILRLIL